MERIPVTYRGRNLGELKLYRREDWRNDKREPTERDFLIINATSGADLVREILEREPMKVGPDEPDKPWVTVVVREVAMAASGGRQDEKMEEQVLILYVSRHGMDQILGIWGADVGKLAEQLKAASGLEDTEN